MLRNPGIKENVFDRPGEGFSLLCFDADREYVCRKMTEKLKKSNVLEFGRLFFDGT